MSIPDRIRTRALELTIAGNRHLAIALVISIVVHAAAIGLFLATASPAEAVPESASAARTRDTIRWIPNDGPDIPLEPLEPAISRPAGDDGVRGGTTNPPKAIENARPVAVDDVSARETDYPTMKEIDRAGTRGTQDGDPNGGGDGTGGEPSDPGVRDPGAATPSMPTDSALDATTIFYSDVELPSVKMSELMARIVYPEIARRNSIEGTVQIKALIGVDGMPERVEVASSVNRILDDAALEAVRATRFGAGRQNKQPVRVWIQIPIRFSLD